MTEFLRKRVKLMFTVPIFNEPLFFKNVFGSRICIKFRLQKVQYDQNFERKHLRTKRFCEIFFKKIVNFGAHFTLNSQKLASKFAFDIRKNVSTYYFMPWNLDPA